MSRNKRLFASESTQKILQIPHTYARQLLGISDARVMTDKLREMSISILNDIKHLRQQVTDPHWLETCFLRRRKVSYLSETY